MLFFCSVSVRKRLLAARKNCIRTNGKLKKKKKKVRRFLFFNIPPSSSPYFQQLLLVLLLLCVVEVMRERQTATFEIYDLNAILNQWFNSRGLYTTVNELLPFRNLVFATEEHQTRQPRVAIYQDPLVEISSESPSECELFRYDDNCKILL